MRLPLMLAAFLLAAPPVFAKAAEGDTNTKKKGKKARAAKGPREGRYCAKKKVGQTAQDKKGNTLECKADGDRARWVKK